MSENRRRSARQRKVNPKYANDGWDKGTLRLLRESSESSGSSPDENAKAAELDVDVEVRAIKTSGGGHASSADGDDVSMASDAVSKSSDVETPDEDDEENGTLASNEDAPAGNAPRRRNPRLPRSAASTTAHSRGLPSGHQRSGQSSIYHLSFGPDVEDLHDILQARDTWLNGRDVTLPSRATLSAAHASQTPDGAAEKASKFARLQSDPIMENQIFIKIEDNELYARYLLQDKPSHSVVLGPLGRQQQFPLEYCSPLDFGQAWPKAFGLEQGQTSPSQERYHEGWLLNVGEKVQCLAWAPGDEGVQYLAIVARCTSTQRQLALGEEDIRPAFHPSPAYPSAIQLWAFQTQATGVKGIRTLSMQTKPRLAVVIGTDWGNIRHIKWRPPPRYSYNYETSNLIGHLGVLSTDGSVRILAIPVSSSTSPLIFKADHAGLTIPPPPNTLFTTLTFAGPTDLILGATDGSIHLFDLSDPSTTPYLTHNQHNTYILSLCTATPSSLPFLASTSATGELTLTDLRSPEQDTVSVPRACFPAKDLVFAPFTRTFITTLDRAGNTHTETSSATFIVAHHLRHFTTTHRVAKLPEHTGAATALAGSPGGLHPCILVGNAKGQVFATNYLRKIMPHRRNDPRSKIGAIAWMQKICEYDWRPLTPPATADGSLGVDIDLYHGRDTRKGVSRFHEGFKPEKVDFGIAANPKKKTPKKDLGAAEPIFEEENAVTALEWNPNHSCAGFAAMGWGSGIVRVQDLAHDM
ncbi:hypothetical protein LTR10_013743 [Elasticomyces elasticus]|uniref:Transcription factor IIIC 90kDa subunit N-terminal domain-containing protein n=1 Tax=Exophiala sideris TaxID=1016849 RepID=A0ABR0JGI4_9EURO|nr:hypothetical protein LTR10_013743 [Elasticomyces elasticus]KAK5033281.1 hypothetical protein LTS07_003583 [Exophiala sideris]KAK5042222.1 hypothetical protein LTR13_002028 [Exophiala sideris]KAK5063825.1 hypothetical protein LTR69_003591 [Exophiala sideris]KAK5185490.1 hypothetical protein LTR44_002479 [Eurotiomycetes sp. CCFEE 6388]